MTNMKMVHYIKTDEIMVKFSCSLHKSLPKIAHAVILPKTIKQLMKFVDDFAALVTVDDTRKLSPIMPPNGKLSVAFFRVG